MQINKVDIHASELFLLKFMFAVSQKSNELNKELIRTDRGVGGDI